MWGVEFPYHTEDDLRNMKVFAPPQLQYFGLLLNKYDPEAEVVFFLTRPGARVSIFVVRSSPSLPDAAKFDKKLN